MLLLLPPNNLQRSSYFHGYNCKKLKNGNATHIRPGYEESWVRIYFQTGEPHNLMEKLFAYNFQNQTQTNITAFWL